MRLTLHPAVAFFGALTIEQVNEYLGAVSLALASAYTIRQLWLSFREKKK